MNVKRICWDEARMESYKWFMHPNCIRYPPFPIEEIDYRHSRTVYK